MERSLLTGFEETFDVAATQIKIADLEKKTGLDFDRFTLAINPKRHLNFSRGSGSGKWRCSSARLNRVD